jgi:hypothetical protein
MDTSSLLRAARLAALGFGLSACASPTQAMGRIADLEIHDRTTGQTLPTYWHDGRAYVVGRPGNEYEVVVRNRTGGDVLAVVSVDGVNAITGQTASTAQSGYVIDGLGRVAVQGWRKSLGETAAFYFTSLGDSYAGRTGRPENVGVIGVALFQRKYPAIAKREQMAPAEPAAAGSVARNESLSRDAVTAQRATAASPSAPLGTGHGRREDSPAEYVAFERASDTPVETLTIYYDSYRNLVAQGVIPTYGARGRDPRPFPQQFAPDPVR